MSAVITETLQASSLPVSGKERFRFSLLTSNKGLVLKVLSIFFSRLGMGSYVAGLDVKISCAQSYEVSNTQRSGEAAEDATAG